MDRADQWMNGFYKRVVTEAARHHLFVDFHGAFTPSGLEYEYPNLLSYEGVRGMEQMGGCQPANSIWLPFIRNAVGAMDYTPGAMLSMQPELYRSERPNAASIGTRAYQLALYVVFESGIQMLADNPTLYRQNDLCTRFIASVPTTWDETRVLAAEAGKYIVVAKRKGYEWFLGGMNGELQSRELTLSLDFLGKGTYRLQQFADGPNANYQAMDYDIAESSVTASTQITLTMARNGGWAGKLSK
jgi:alpha-glucosidase